VKIYTIGFTRKPAERFFELLKDNHVSRLIDIRLKPGGQLAGFAKQDDLAYFLRELVGCEYHHFDFLGSLRWYSERLSPKQGLGSL
jgi:uncharacterized protein (DUF488 family)